MKLFGLTGGIGMGKSTAADWLRGQKVAVMDTDAVARQVVEPGQPALAEIRQAFGEGVIGPEGGLKRSELARWVFADEEARRRLEAILHPRIREIWKTQAAAWRAEGRPLAVVVIPLLFETQAQQDVDATVCVACAAASQQTRLLERGWTIAEIARRIQAQMPIEKKMDLADYVIWSEGALATLNAQLARVLRI